LHAFTPGKGTLRAILVGAIIEAHIENCISGIEEITRRGGWVIQIGDESMKALSDMDRVIDYPFSAYKSDGVDLFLVAHCRLYIGTFWGQWNLRSYSHAKC